MTLDDPQAPTRRARRVTVDSYADLSFAADVTDNPYALDPISPGQQQEQEQPVEAPVEQAAPEAPEAPVEQTAPESTEAPVEQAAPEAPAEQDAPEAPVATNPVASDTAALAWVDEASVAGPRAPLDLSTATSGYIPAEADLLADAPRRSLLRAGVLVPVAVSALVVGTYAATTLLWPLHAVAPTVSALEVTSAEAPAAAPAWPKKGSAAISVEGISNGTLASATDAHSIASITKVVTALVVLEELPLDPGEDGPSFSFGYGDMLSYWDYRARGESALDVPVDGSLSEYQMLEGMLVGSANNYADRLASSIWPSDAVFADAANGWLDLHGVSDVTIVEPTGMDAGNAATPAALITLAKKALANPVIAEIVAKEKIELPGAGVVENTNELLADDGMLGIKTGTLDTYNVLSAKSITVGDTPVRLYASVLGQSSDAARNKVSRALYAQTETELQPQAAVAAGTLTARVETAWGEPVDIVASDDASVILWDGRSGEVTTTYSLGESREAGDVVGSMAVEGPLDAAEVELTLADDVDGPSPWWRLTHPLELFGLAD